MSADAGVQRIALLVDSKMAACLMMSNLADELKQHAVTLYEVGKIPNEALDAFQGALTEVERPQIDEVEVLEYFDQALALHAAVGFLRSHAACAVGGQVRPLDIVRTESLSTLDNATRDRVLSRSYCLLISMAPMVPAIEHIYSHALPIHHFGPTHRLLTSPWLMLSIWAAMGRGPRCVVLPKGTRLRVLPRALLGCSFALVVPWVGEPMSVAVGSLLSLVAELLLRTPLLLQAHVAPSAESGGGGRGRAKPDRVVSVALPVGVPTAAADGRGEQAEEVEQQEGEGADVEAYHEDEEAGSARAAALAVQRAFFLDHTIGTLTLVQLPLASSEVDSAESGGVAAEGRPDAATKGVEEERSTRMHWVPTALHFGLPLSDVPTVQAAFAAIAQRKLLGEASLQSHAKALDSLLASVRSCAKIAVDPDAGGDEPGLEEKGGSDAVGLLPEDADDDAYPEIPLVFDGTVLRAARSDVLLGASGL